MRNFYANISISFQSSKNLCGFYTLKRDKRSILFTFQWQNCSIFGGNITIICVSVPIFLILIFQTRKRYDFDSVWACVSHAATCHDNHQVGLAQRHLLFCLIMHLNKSSNFQKMFGSFFYFTAAKFALSFQRWTQRSWAESSNCSFASDGRTPGFDVVNN